MREHARYLQVAYGSSERRVCGVLTFGRSTCRYESVAAEQAALRMRIRDLAASRVSYGYRRIHVLLRREGWKVNHKRVYRLYRLRMRPKRPRRHVSGRRRETRAAAARPDERWAMDFMSDELFDGRRIRTMTIVDHFSRESPAILVDGSLGGRRVCGRGVGPADASGRTTRWNGSTRRSADGRTWWASFRTGQLRDDWWERCWQSRMTSGLSGDAT